MMELKCEWKIPAVLGEGPLWVARENALYWVDVLGRKVHRLRFADGERTTWTFDTEVSCLAARASGGFVGTTRHGVAFFDFGADAVTPALIAEPEAGLPGNRFNDGKADVHGRFWMGTIDEAGWKDETGSLYRLNRDLSIEKIDAPYICGNGPAFSRDNTLFYYTETKKGILYVFDFDAEGEIRNKRPFLQWKHGDTGVPDGMTVDSEDCLWVCHFGGMRVNRYSPRGDLLRTLSLPVPNVTSCTFGGPDLDTLFITTARHGMSKEGLARFPLAGSLFSCKPGVKGLPTPLFAG